MRRNSGGFTLIEITVVLFIIGVLAGFAVLSLGSRAQDSRFETEARRLEKLVELAAEEAESQGIEIGLRFEKNSYEFLTPSPEGAWAPLEAKGSLRARQLPEPFYVELTIEGRAVKTATAEDEEQKPQILLLSSGEASAFVLELRVPKQKQFYRLEGDALGKLKLEYKESGGGDTAFAKQGVREPPQ